MTEEELQTIGNLNVVPTHDYSILVVVICVIALVAGAVFLRSMFPIVPEYKYTDS